MNAAPVRTEIVLIGGGHSHVEVMRRFAMAPEPGVRLTVIARDIETPYSGMIPGYFAAHYSRSECHIDLRPLAARAGARLYQASATGIDPAQRRVLCDVRPPVRYDVVSLDIGSAPDTSLIPGAADHVIPVKPIDGLLASVEAIEAVLAGSTAPLRIAVIGAGAGGVELILALDHRLKGPDGRRVSFTLVEAAPQIMPSHAVGARRALTRALVRRGIDLRLGTKVGAIDDGMIRCEGAPDIPFDHAILVSGAGAPGWVAVSGLETDERGFLRVDRHLRSLSHPDIFAAGDVAAFDPRALPKSGVYAVRAGPVLAENLRRAAQGRPLTDFRPQRQTLALISTGPRHAVASRGPFSLSGRFMWTLKDRIDRRFMEKYADLPPMKVRAGEGAADPLETMRCGGCGAKIGRAVLARALQRLPKQTSEAVLQGLDAPDDAAVLAPPPPGEVVVETVDQFRAFIDDPWLFGRIAANHCLGDLFAMGAAPKAALAMAVLPHGDPAVQEDDLAALLTGAAEVLGEAGAVLAGGHTGEGAELAFGLAVTGHGAPERLMRRAGLRDGDALILTKPLGTGVLFNADMQAGAGGAAIAQALEVMQVSSGAASVILASHGARGVCDVTGFGLAGHLGEMLDASGVDARLDPGAVPVLAGVAELVDRGFESTLAPANRAAATGLLGASDHPSFPLLFDPQTAGGLLAGVSRARAGDCVAALIDAGYADAAIIGRVTARSGSAARIEISE